MLLISTKETAQKWIVTDEAIVAPHMKPSDAEKASILGNSMKFRDQDRSDEVKVTVK